MSHTEKASTLNFCGVCSKGQRSSEVYVTNINNASPEAKICLTCPLPAKKCRPNVCQRLKDELNKIKKRGG